MDNFDSIFTANNTQQEQTNIKDDFDREAWAQQKQAERDGVFAMLDTLAQDMSRNPDTLRQYLDTQSRFMRMSANNAMLISSQCPTATQLASFDDWKAQDVSILAGEKAIAILEQGGSFTRDDGTEGRYTNVAKVFDISQTSAEPKPAPTYEAADLMKALSAHSSATIEMVDNLPDGRNSIYQPENNTVFVRRGLDANTLFASLTHDLAMASLCKDGSMPRDNALSAYAASYILCAKYGMDTTRFSVEKMSEALGGMDSKGIRDQLGKARNAAESVSYNMEKTLSPQQRTDRNNEAR